MWKPNGIKFLGIIINQTISKIKEPDGKGLLRKVRDDIVMVFFASVSVGEGTGAGGKYCHSSCQPSPLSHCHLTGWRS